MGMGEDTTLAFVAGAAAGAVVASCVTLAITRASARGAVSVAARAAAADAERSAVAARGADTLDEESRAGRGEGSARQDFVVKPMEGAADAVPTPRRRAWREGSSVYFPDLSAAHVAAPGCAPTAPSVAAVASTPDEYAGVATDYARAATLAERMASRARGVSNVLAERLSDASELIGDAASKFEGAQMADVPVIERSDGTVADVGESWWDDIAGGSRVTGASSRELGGEGVVDGMADNSAALFCAQLPAAAQDAIERVRARAEAVSRPAPAEASPDEPPAAEPESEAEAPATPEPAPAPIALATPWHGKHFRTTPASEASGDEAAEAKTRTNTFDARSHVADILAEELFRASARHADARDLGADGSHRNPPWWPL